MAFVLIWFTYTNSISSFDRETGALCAMKEVEILPDDLKSAECIKQLEQVGSFFYSFSTPAGMTCVFRPSVLLFQEIVVLSQLIHPNIVQYYGSEIVSYIS